MKAIVVEQPGRPEVLQLKEIPTPDPRPGWILIKIRAFGLNRSEMYTRQGHSGDAVTFPRVLGIECVGEVKDAGGSELHLGQKVAALMGGMGRKYDGSYAEHTLVPQSQVIPVDTNLSWEQFSAIPETFMTAWGSLVKSIELQEGQTLLVRGGTSSVGMAATTIAKNIGATVVATTRNESKSEALLANGADHVVIDRARLTMLCANCIPTVSIMYWNWSAQSLCAIHSTQSGQKGLSVSQAFWVMNGCCENFPLLKSPRLSS